MQSKGGLKTASIPGHMVRAARAAAVVNLANGTGIYGQSTVEHIVAGSKGGIKTAQIPGHLSKAGKIGGVVSTHRQWHVNRGLVSPNCSLCDEEELKFLGDLICA
jgi:hypothetical protein